MDTNNENVDRDRLEPQQEQTAQILRESEDRQAQESFDDGLKLLKDMPPSQRMDMALCFSDGADSALQKLLMAYGGHARHKGLVSENDETCAQTLKEVLAGEIFATTITAKAIDVEMGAVIGNGSVLERIDLVERVLDLRGRLTRTLIDEITAFEAVRHPGSTGRVVVSGKDQRVNILAGNPSAPNDSSADQVP